MKDNYNIKVNPPKLSSEDIGKHKNFDALLEQFNKEGGAQTGKSGASKPLIKYIGIGLLGLAATIALIFTVRGLFNGNAEKEGLLALKGPFSDIKKEFTNFEVDADKGDTIHHSSGSVIVVPASAFVDKKGLPVAGKVDIQYRQFDDPVDMFLAGVPQSDGAQTLQRAGLMQIQGFKDGEPVYIGKDKELQMELKATVSANMPLEDLKSYAYTAQEKKWTEGSTVKVEVISESGQLENPMDTVIKNDGSLKSKAAFLAELQKKYAKPVKPFEPSKGTPKGMIALGLDFNSKDFPEFAQYENVEWVAAKSIVSPLPEEGWSDMKVNRLSDMKYEIVMIPNEASKNQGRKEVRFEAFPLIPYTQKTKADYDKSLLAYKSAETKREEILNNELRAWEQGEGRFANVITDNKDDKAPLKSIISRFAVKQFGLWSAANKFNMDQLASVKPEFRDANGNKVAVAEVFVADNNRQLFYSSSETASLHFDAGNEHVQLWAIGTDGSLLVAAPAPKEEGKTVRFVMQPASVKTETDIRKLLTM